MRRHKKKIGKQRGTRSIGRGNTKHGRGKGSRRGHKQTSGANYAYVLKNEPWRLGREKGFHPVKKKMKGINLRSVEKLSKEEIIDITKFGYDKVLGGGELSSAKKIIARQFTKSAKTKIEKAGGQAVVLGAAG